MYKEMMDKTLADIQVGNSNIIQIDELEKEFQVYLTVLNREDIEGMEFEILGGDIKQLEAEETN